jgi:type IV pilus assembly protein PilV
MMKMKTVSSTHTNRGFSLIEVLIAILVLSMGLLGNAGLVAASLKNSNTAYYRSQASLQAADILDRMRANLPNDRTLRLAEAAYYIVTLNGTCGGSGLANTECTEWRQSIAATLPAGTGAVSVSNTGLTTITIQWGNPTESFVTTSML